jgi:Ribosomal protein L11 methyltransferase (PrmA)
MTYHPIMTSPQTDTSWREYYADSDAGLAFFDGMFIESDSIKDPRIDRVLAILEEEQIFMCRQMAPRLQPGSLVLDVGTGSGVFSIWAALHGCRVLAIDINKRAIEMACKNAKRNYIELFDDPLMLANGSICFLNERFEQGFDRGAFDIIFLSAPHNPTYPKIKPALHAEAGEDGQAEFNKQITLVPEMLKLNGYCIGNHMSTVNIDGEIEALLKISAAFTEGYETQYVRTLPEDIETRYFLEGQYESYLATNCDGLKEYISSVSAKWPKLSLFYFETQKTIGPKNLTTIHNTPKVHAKWGNRILLHQSIVDNIEPFPRYVKDLFGATINSFDSCSREQLLLKPTKGNESISRSLWNNSKLFLLDKIFKEEGLDEKLDILLIDTAPLHRDFNGSIDSLEQESKVWLGQKFSHKRKEIGKNILLEWLSTVRANQISGIATLQHPSFTGLLPVDEWSAISSQTRYLDGAVDDENQKLYTNHLADKREQTEISPRSILNVENFYEDSSYSCTTLKQMDAPNIKQYYRNSQILTDGGICFSEIIDQYQKGDAVRRMQISEELKQDLMRRSFALHHVTDKHMLDQIREYESPDSQYCSMMISLPLWLYKNSSEEIETDKLPEYYRGGIWMYILSSSREKLDDCRDALVRISKTAWLLYMDEYTLEAVDAESSYKQNQIQNAFGHQMKHIGRAIFDHWLSDIEKFFDIEKAPTKHNLQEGKIGSIRLYSDTSIDLIQSLKLALIPELFYKVKVAMSLWSMSDYHLDVDEYNYYNEGVTLEKFIHQCYLAAWDSQVIFYFRSIDLSTVQLQMLASNRIKDLETIKDYLVKRVYVESDGSLKKLNDKEKNIWLGRAIIEIFSNILRHGAWPETIHITLKGLTSQNYSIEVKNHIFQSRKSEKEAIKDFLSNINLLSNHESFTSFLDQGNIRAKNISQDKVNSSHVIRSCLEKIDRNAYSTVDLSPSNDKNDIWLSKITFKY